jgi:putative intracellular protease/amidase
MLRSYRILILSLKLITPALLLAGKVNAQSVEPTRRLQEVVLRVAIFDGPGVSESNRRVEEDLRRVPELNIQRIGVEQITSGSLTGQDVVIFPGGSGGGQGRGLGESGRNRVREFVAAGGGYVGICAGAYLASADYDWSLSLLDARVLDRRHWARGFGNVELTVAPDAAELLGLPAKATLYYHQGPLLAPAGKTDIPDYREWATFATEVRKEGVPGGVMPGTTAIAAGEFGAGRVLAISPHPERTEEWNHVLPAAVRWVAGKSTRSEQTGGQAQ